VRAAKLGCTPYGRHNSAWVTRGSELLMRISETRDMFFPASLSPRQTVRWWFFKTMSYSTNYIP